VLDHELFGLRYHPWVSDR